MPKLIDLTNQRFGKLVVLKMAERKKGDPVKWLCQCDCGALISVRTSDLRSGHTKSCGCLKGNKKNLVGQKFGELTVISVIPNKRSKEGSQYWLCQCSCGKQIEVKTNHLTTGNTKSCGCVRINKLKEQNSLRAIDISNQKFGLLTALYPNGTNNNNSIVWHCKCDCGKETDVSVSDLKSGNTKSCGCLKSSYGEYIIEKLLQENNIPYVKEKTFDTCRFTDTKYLAKFDFYVNEQYLIEYDGKQHFKVGTGIYDNPIKFQQTKEHDKYKEEWCKENNIPLIRIPYTNNNIKIEDLLLESTIYGGLQ